MMGSRDLTRAMLPLPYNFMRRLGTFETGKSNLDSCLWMMHDMDSFNYFAKLEWLTEAKSREDLVNGGFKVKKLGTP